MQYNKNTKRACYRSVLPLQCKYLNKVVLVAHFTYLLVLWTRAENNLDAEISRRDGRDTPHRALLPARARAPCTADMSILLHAAQQPAAKPGLDLPWALCPKNLLITGQMGLAFSRSPGRDRNVHRCVCGESLLTTRHVPLSERRVITDVMSIKFWIS